MFTAVSLILTLAMLTMPLGGSDGYNKQIIINDINIEGENINYTSDAALTLFSSTAEGKQTYGLSISKEGLDPITSGIAIDGDNILINAGSDDHYFVFSDEALNNSASEGIINVWDSTASLALCLANVFGNDEETSYAALSEYFDAFVSANATSALDYTDTIGKKKISGKTVEMDVSIPHLFKALDTVSASENSDVSALLQELLNAFNAAENTGYSSFSEISGDLSYEVSIPVTLTIASDEEGTASRQLWSTSNESDEGAIDLQAQLDTDGKNVSLVFNLKKASAAESITANISADLILESDDVGELNTVCSIIIANSDEQGSTNTALSLTIRSDFDKSAASISAKCNIKTAEDDQRDFTINVNTNYEDTSAVSNIEFSISENAAEKPLTASFVSIASTDSYNTPFNGAEISVSDDPASCILLFGDIVDLMNNITAVYGDDAPILPDSDLIYTFITNLFAFEDENSGADDPESSLSQTENSEDIGSDNSENQTNDPTEDDAGSESSSTDFDSIEAAAKVYGGYIPEIQTPDGYYIQDITADVDSLLVEFSDGKDGYISIFVINDSELYDEYPVYYDNEDGTIYAADLLVNGVNVSVYIPDMSVSDAEALFAQMGLN